MYQLTEEGKKYLRFGLPEINLAKMLEKGPLHISEAQKMDGFGIAFSWAKKKEWVRVDGSRIILLEMPKHVEEQEALAAIDKGEDVPANILKILIQRKLVAEVRDDARRRAERLAGKELAGLTPDLIKTGLWKNVALKEYNVSVIGEKKYPGKKQHYLAFLDYVRSKLVSLGFAEMTGPLVETEFWNMDALYMPQHHAARDIHDAYFIKEPKYATALDKKLLEKVKKSHEKGVAGSRGWEYQYDIQKAHRLILRTQGTVLSAKTLAGDLKVPGKYFSIMRCFRYDVIDATHLPDFYQVEGIIVDKGLNFRHLAGVLRMFAREFANTHKIKLVPGYFPFTEPSVELHVKHDALGWIELGGAGIFRPEMTLPLGVDVPVLAWGLGIDRIGMCNMGINDIRDLFTHDLKKLRETRVVY
ncbi:MAG: phenylalanine--tRNA ligase subunit alpha [Candidatus Aenigmarchaeota archaeon]|nr:phenylalanine--tRNA ligase subunit alpha [Candidatus Aenigmarchaeota archaeon]